MEYESTAVGSRLARICKALAQSSSEGLGARWPRRRRLFCASLLALAAEHLKSGVAVSSLCLVKLSAGLARDYRGHEISRSLVIAAFVSKSLGSISTGGVMSGSFSASHRVWASQLHLSFKTRGQTL